MIPPRFARCKVSDLKRKGRGRMVCENLQEKMELFIEFIGEMW